MIGHYVDTLSRAAEDRVLTSKLGYASLWISGDCRCLVGAAAGIGGSSQNYDPQEWARNRWPLPTAERPNPCLMTVGAQYDILVKRFGERLNIAIRNRILANRARRLLAQPREEAAWAR